MFLQSFLEDSLAIGQKSTRLKPIPMLYIYLCLSIELSDTFTSMVTDIQTERQIHSQQTTVTLAARAHQGLIRFWVIYLVCLLYSPFHSDRFRIDETEKKMC